MREESRRGETGSRQGEDLLKHEAMPLTMTRNGEGNCNLDWNGVRAGFLEQTRNGRLEMLLILEHEDGSVIQHSARYRNQDEAVEALRVWTPTRDGVEVTPEEARHIRAAFRR